MRHVSRPAASLVLAVFIATLALPLFASGHGLGDDVDAGWGGTRIGFGHPVTQVQPIYPADADEHCAICHWARTFGSSVTAVVARYIPPVAVGAVVVCTLNTAADVALNAGPPRGPPSLL